MKARLIYNPSSGQEKTETSKKEDTKAKKKGDE